MMIETMTIGQPKRRLAICPECGEEYEKLPQQRRCHECSRRANSEQWKKKLVKYKRPQYEVGSPEAYERMILGSLTE